MTTPGRDIDASESIATAVRDAAARGHPLGIVGGGSKSFLGRATQLEPLDVRAHRGIVDYEPTELVMTARAGTPLAEVEAALAARGQMMPFEPPRLGAAATLGGTIAAGLSGPRRPYAGAARDHVLGTRIVNGSGEILSFGGQVMKNVAGYDLSRLMVGAMGGLGVLLDVSMKVLPAPTCTETRVFEAGAVEAIERMNAWAGRPLPVSGACHDGARIRLRLSGTENGVHAAARRLGGEPAADGDDFWEALKEMTLPLFQGHEPLWRLSVAPSTPPLDLPGRHFLDWGGAQRWLATGAPARDVRAAVAGHGHATLFAGGDRTGEVFTPLPAPLMNLHRRLKNALDPVRILNPGRMYADL